MTIDPHQAGDFGACVRCGRVLTNAESAAAGMGPVCRAKASRSDSGALLGDTPVLCDVPPIKEAGLICRRLESGAAAANVPHVWKLHSPTGFEWGYGGSGPADLALNALLAYGVSRKDAERLHQEFKWAFIVPISQFGGIVARHRIDEWLERHAVAA